MSQQTYAGLGTMRARAALILAGVGPQRAGEMLSQAIAGQRPSEPVEGSGPASLERDPDAGTYTVSGDFPW
jgi:hypothetical protein